MNRQLKITAPDWMDEGDDSSVQNLAPIWAKKYITNLNSVDDVVSLEKNLQQISDQLHSVMRISSIKAWVSTEKLISKEMERYEIDHNLIDPWQIAQDSFVVYDKAIELYSQQLPPEKISRELGAYISAIRAHYTASDVRIIGFVSLQFHYTGQLLLNYVPQSEQARLNSYFKVIDDHLYMPLQRAYQAAAAHDYKSRELGIIRQLMPMSTEIATKICDRVIELYPYYSSYSGYLTNPAIKVASIRDTEMFQMYLWVCILEKSIASVQEELFPLCLMLYPTLKVSWELVWQMIELLGNEIRDRLDEEQREIFVPYFQALWKMFNPAVLPGVID
jgi:Phycobilisome protein